MGRKHIVRAASGMMISVLMMAMSSVAMAAEKDYTVKAPDGVTIAVQETGNPDGRPIVFIHGLLGSHLNWDKQTDSAKLQHYRLITYDMRGHGKSGKPDDAESYHDGRRWADDLSTVLKASGAKDPVLVGWRCSFKLSCRLWGRRHRRDHICRRRDRPRCGPDHFPSAGICRHGIG